MSENRTIHVVVRASVYEKPVAAYPDEEQAHTHANGLIDEGFGSYVEEVPIAPRESGEQQGDSDDA